MGTMKRVKQLGLYVILTVTLGLLLWMMFPSFWEDCAVSVSTGQQTLQYVQSSVNVEGAVHAVARQGEEWRLVRGDGRSRNERLMLKRLGITEVQSVNQVYACANGGTILTVYQENEGLVCRAYYIAPDAKTAQVIFGAVCQGGSIEDVRLTGFSEDWGTVAFLYEYGAEMTVYCFTPGEESARKVSNLMLEQGQVVLYARTDGSAAVTEKGTLTIGRETMILPEGVDPIAGWHLTDGACLLDSVTGDLWRVDTDSGKIKRLFSLEFATGMIDLSVSSDQRILLLTDDGELQLWRDGTTQDYSEMLYRQRWQSTLFLILGASCVLLTAMVLWYVLWELRKMQLSMVIRYGVVMTVVLSLLTATAVRWVVRPHYEEQAETWAEAYLRTAILAAPEPMVDPMGADWDYDDTLTTRSEYIYALWRAFGSPQVEIRSNFVDVPPDSPYRMAVEWALYYNITSGTGEHTFSPDKVLTAEQAFRFLYYAMRYIGGGQVTLVKEGETLYRVESDGGKTILPALMLGGEFRQGVETALETGSALVRYTNSGADYYAALSSIETNRLTMMSTPAAQYLAAAEQGAEDTARLLWMTSLVSLLLMLTVLASVSGSLRRVTKGMTAIQNGSFVEVVDRGGDEVSAMADSLNSMARSLWDASAKELRRGDVYARFLPNQITELLEVPTVESINKQTFASRVMTTIHISFSFDQQVYESRSKELFHHINEVTECTARIISAQGGMILSFAYNGFDALFEPDSSAPISAAVAVQQEIISINRAREQRGQSPVALHITLDSGEVMLGVVGDETRIQATAVSSSFNTARMLDALFTQFDANILCTERMERWIDGYGSRYIGKTHDGAELIRVYEIYDGDPYEIRQGKAETEQSFAEGVYSLYGGDYTAAKCIFMEIVRRNSGDGAARYYLYLADRFEKESSGEVCLDC